MIIAFFLLFSSIVEFAGIVGNDYVALLTFQFYFGQHVANVHAWCTCCLQIGLEKSSNLLQDVAIRKSFVSKVHVKHIPM